MLILQFSNTIGNDILFSYSNLKGLGFASKVTRFVFMRVDELNAFKSLSKAEKKALKDTSEILKRLNTLEAKKNYIVGELDKLGFALVDDFTDESGETDVNLYLKKWRNNEFS